MYPLKETDSSALYALFSAFSISKDNFVGATTESDGKVLVARFSGKGEFTLTLNADTTTVVEARLRPEKTVTTINAQMKFLNEKDEPKGEPFEKFVFEKDFVNPVTGEMHKGGTITVYVEAVVPKGYVIDYWKINEIPYYYNKTVSAFVVEELDESTVYEVVLREAKATPTPKPTKTPNATPVPTQEQEIVDPEEDWKDTPAPEATPAPVMYNVSCARCSYGGGKTSGQVPAGTTITVTGRGDLSGRFYVNGSAAGEYVKSITLTIDRDTDIEFNEIIN